MKYLKSLSVLLIYCIGLICIIGGILSPAAAQKPRLVKDYSFVMEIPAVKALESSLTHVYVLSEAEGLAVFRSRPDTLQWLYTTPGMSKRGHRLESDIRFAYLYGNQSRFSVIEPTSVVGVYSSTDIPFSPDGVHRIRTKLYMGLDSLGIGRLSLSTPSAFDSTITYIKGGPLKSSRVLSLTGSGKKIIAATDAPALLEYQLQNGSVKLQNRISTDHSYTYLFATDKHYYASTSGGKINRINSGGKKHRIGKIGEPVLKIRPWKKWLIIRGTSGRLWASYKGSKPVLWKDNGKAGNYFTINKGRFWINEYNKIYRIKQVNPLAETQQDTLGLFTNIRSLKLKPIPKYTTPLPHPVLVPVELDESYPVEAIQLTYESPTIEDAYLRKQGFYWQPGSDDVGSHKVTLIASASSGATDSVQFSIEVKSFNSPPRFPPLRTVTVPVGEEYTLPIKAFDPDGTYRNLIRYLGMNLPKGSNIDQKTGKFHWTPNPNQLGMHSFKVIATDRFGAASSKKVQIEVIQKPKQDQQ